MRRRLVTILAAASAVLCVAVAICWAVGREGEWERVWHFGRAGYRPLLRLQSGSDATAIYWERQLPFHGWAIWRLTGCGFGFTRYSDFCVLKICMYHRSGVFGLGVLSVLLFRWRTPKTRRSRAGHCPHCGYDLRATPERCPECGRGVAR